MATITIDPQNFVFNTLFRIRWPTDGGRVIIYGGNLIIPEDNFLIFLNRDSNIPQKIQFVHKKFNFRAS